MSARIRVALVSLAMSAGGLAGFGSLDKQSDLTTEWLVLPDISAAAGSRAAPATPPMSSSPPSATTSASSSPG